jgi:hypothetical protein
MVLDLNEFAVGRRCGQTEDFAVINPRVSGHNAVSFARL